MGPIGSGKSVACCWELVKLAYNQHPNKDGIRKSRVAVIRNSYRELADTTMKTFFDWFPPDSIGTFLKTTATFTITTKLPDNTEIQLEILFRALDKPQDVKKLLSLELSYAWINEAREIPKQIVDMLQGRVGRFPSAKDGGCTRHCIIMDTNPPDSDHWWYKVFEEQKPNNWHLSSQPSGLSDEAENLNWLLQNEKTLALEYNHPDRLDAGRKYYETMMQGKDPEWVNVYVHGSYGFVSEGRPVYPMFNDSIHYNSSVEFIPNIEVHLGIDFGLTPACVFVQQIHTGRFVVIDELVTTNTNAFMLVDLIKEKCSRQGYTISLESYADPSGRDRKDTDSNNAINILAVGGINVEGTRTNDPSLRIGAVTKALTTLAMDGIPRLTIGPKCKVLRKAFNGGYAYKRIQVSNSEIFRDTPEKNHYSHISDALQYALLGLGVGDEMVYGEDSGYNTKVIRGIN